MWISNVYFLALVLCGLAEYHYAKADCQDEETSFSDSEFQAIRIIPAIGSSFSIIGASFIVFTYFYIETLQRGHYNLIACMSFADGMAALSVLMGAASNVENSIDCKTNGFCWFQAMLMLYFELASLFWVLCIALKLSLAILSVIHSRGEIGGPLRFFVCLLQSKEKDKFEMRFYHGLSWGFPLFLTIIAMSTDVFGDTGQWCWIKSDHQWARFGLYYGWLLIIMTFVALMFAYTIYEAKGSLNLEISKPLAFRLRLYLLAFFITKFFSIVNRFHNLAHPDSPNFALNLLQSIFEPFTGFANALVYGANKMVIREYMNLFFKTRSFSVDKADPATPKSVLRKSRVNSDSDDNGDGMKRQSSFRIADPESGGDSDENGIEAKKSFGIKSFASMQVTDLDNDDATAVPLATSNSLDASGDTTE